MNVEAVHFVRGQRRKARIAEPRFERVVGHIEYQGPVWQQRAAAAAQLTAAVQRHESGALGHERAG